MNTYNGAIVLVAVLPLLPLAVYLRRRGKLSSRSARAAAAASLVLLVCGIGALAGNGL